MSIAEMMFWGDVEYGDDFDDTSSDEASFGCESFYLDYRDSTAHKTFVPKRKPRPFIGESLFSELKSFLLSDELSDVIVKVGAETFKCHKIILSVWCPYFRGLFASGMMESQKGFVELSTLEPEDFRNLLQIFYTGDIEVNQENLEGLLFASSYLQVKVIQDECMCFMTNNLSSFDPERTFKYLKICRLLDIDETADMVIEFMLNWFENHVKCADFADLSKEDMWHIISSLNVPEKVTEDDICDALFTWLTADLGSRKIHISQFIDQIRHLALSEEYMKNTFLDHPVMAELESKERIHLRKACGSYLSNKLTQHEVIGEVEAQHRGGSRLQDVVVVLYCSKFYCFIPGCDKRSRMSSKGWYHIDLPTSLLHEATPDSITACNYGRSEMYVSTGKSFTHFNGMTAAWSEFPPSAIHKSNNCLVLDPEKDAIYSVTSKGEGIFIEKIALSHSSLAHWKILICGYYGLNRKTLQAIQNDKYHNKYQSWSNQTCAFMANRNIYLLHSTDQYSWFGINTAIFSYSIDMHTVSFIASLPVVGTCTMAAKWSNLVFLVDQDCRKVLRVNSDQFSIDEYGEIGHDTQPSDVKRTNFGGTYWDGKLIIVGGACCGCAIEDTRGYLQYDLDSHQTQKVPWELDNMYPNRAYVLKLTVDVSHLA